MIETDIIGPLFDPPFVEGGEPIPLSGWHVNTTLQGLAARPDLTPFVVAPAQLRREWARLPGEPQITVALRFADEAEARSVLSAYWVDDA